MIEALVSSGSLPVLEQSLRFAGARQRVLAHNIANLETPNFQPLDVDPREFQRTLAAAIDERRERTGGTRGELAMRSSSQIEFTPGGGLKLTPATVSGNILFHDRNNRDLERSMQDLAENAGAYRVAAGLLRSRMSILRSAISERI